MPKKSKSKLKTLLRDSYNAKSIAAIAKYLEAHRSHLLRPVANGLFAATPDLKEGSVSGYQNAWIRDNVMVANSFRLRGKLDIARGASQGLSNYFSKHLHRFRKIISSPALKENVQERPHVRFDALTLGEISENWPHAQNDALGYALWLRFAMANSAENPWPLTASDWQAYSLFPDYFAAIEFWSDPDSGSWEETRKVNNSSVGAVVAGLEQIRHRILQAVSSRAELPAFVDKQLLDKIDSLIEKGRVRLAKTLPFESPPERMMDGALLFLIYPVGVLKSRDIENSILNLVEARLRGPKGIKRYLGDSYFCQDYDRWFPPEQQAADFSNSIAYRDSLLEPGCEAQWNLFDPIVSIIHGRRFAESRQASDLERQTLYFNRSLSQNTGDGQCPELYFLREGKFVVNDHTPLAWTQANQALALHYMEKSVRKHF
jgi:GH15 family glucan-1,4-alpha-glucosidase